MHSIAREASEVQPDALEPRDFEHPNRQHDDIVATLASLRDRRDDADRLDELHYLLTLEQGRAGFVAVLDGVEVNVFTDEVP